MNNKELIESGILEQYVMGNTTAEETVMVEERAAEDAEIRAEITAISKSLEAYAMQHAITPNILIKPFLWATIDYTQRLMQGEDVTFPPMLNEKSLITDYDEWLSRKDMVLPDFADTLYAKIIGYTPQANTAIVWIKDYAPHEVHDNEYERFLIVEGTCNILVDDEVNALVPGNYFAIPLHKKHLVKVTSNIPCKVILQRVAVA